MKEKVYGQNTGNIKRDCAGKGGENELLSPISGSSVKGLPFKQQGLLYPTKCFHGRNKCPNMMLKSSLNIYLPILDRFLSRVQNLMTEEVKPINVWHSVNHIPMKLAWNQRVKYLTLCN